MLNRDFKPKRMTVRARAKRIALLLERIQDPGSPILPDETRFYGCGRDALMQLRAEVATLVSQVESAE